MKIAYVLDQLILCGGVIVPFEHCRELIKRGYDARVFANGTNETLAKRYPEVPIEKLSSLKTTDSDIITAVWWPQVEELSKKPGRKLQLVQGHDLEAYTGEDWRMNCLKTRRDPNWEIIAVSKYAGEWIGREFTVIPNGLGDEWFDYQNGERDVDILVEGNDEENKRIKETIKVAKEITPNVAWLTRQNNKAHEVKVFENPDNVPEVYRRAKIFLKLSKSEGFCLPCLEAMASGCLVVTLYMGGNDFCEHGYNCLFEWERADWALKYYNIPKAQKLIKNAKQTAKQYTWRKSIDKLEQKVIHRNS